MTSDARLTSEAIRQLTLVSDPWLSCDDCFDQTDVVIEQVLSGASTMSEPFRVHLVACSACREEARSLAMLVARDFDLPPDRAVAMLEAELRDDC